MNAIYTNSAYLNNSLVAFKDKSKPLVVGSCGTYRLISRPKLPTQRPRGRLDFQIIYVVAGKAYFYFDNQEEPTIVTAGHMVVYRPKEPQKYVYYGEDQTEVYWVHFTGGNVTNILRSYGIADDMRVIYTGTSLEYANIFKQMIQELQRCQADFREMLVLLLRQIFISIHRQLTRENHLNNDFMDKEMELAIEFFDEHYPEDIRVENYAASRGMSVSWFIRSFKQYTKTTPRQYIMNIRMMNAQILLENTSYNVTEIGAIVGYDNPLYFSRIFRKQKGVSPSAYRRQRMKVGNLDGVL